MGIDRPRRTDEPAGFSLLELMIVLLLSTPLMMSMLQWFGISQRNSLLLREQAVLQHGTRMSFHLLQREIRSAGDGLCLGAGGTFAVVVNHRPEQLAFFRPAALQGFGPGAPPPPAWSSAVLPGSDSLLLRRAGDRISGFVLRHSTPYLYVRGGEDFKRGAILLLGDASCAQTTLLQLGERRGQRLDYRNNGIRPGNCSQQLGGSGDCASMQNLRSHLFAPGSELRDWHVSAYYLGTGADGIPTLFRERLFSGENGLGSRAEAILSGVEQLRILYVSDAAERALSAAEIARRNLWPRVRGVYLWLRLRSRIELPEPPFAIRNLSSDSFLRQDLHFSVALRSGMAP